MMLRSLGRTVFAALALFSTLAYAEPAMRVEASTRQGDGKLLFAGDSRTGTGPASISVGRLNTDGTYDGTFGATGLASYSPPGGASEFRVTAVAVQPDGKVVVAAVKDGLVALIRFESTGAVDSTFGDGGIAIDVDSLGQRTAALGVQSNGSIIAAGSFNAGTGGYWVVALVRYSSTGQRDLSFGGGPQGARLHPFSSGDNEARALVMVADDRFVVAGYVQEVGADKNMLVAKFDWQGNPDYSFGVGGRIWLNDFEDDVANAIAVDSLGRLIVGGRNGHGMGGGSPASWLVVKRLDQWGSFESSLGGTFVREDGYGPIRDAEITSIAIGPLNNEVFVGSTALNVSTGHRAFAVTEVYAFNPMPLPVYSESTNLVGITVDGERVVAVGTRAYATGNEVARARYFMGPFQYDTDFANAGNDSTPNAFYFNGVSERGPAEVANSSQVRITGIDVPTPISVQGGEYAISWSGTYNCDGAFTSVPGTIQNGQWVCLRHVAATTPFTTTTTTLTIGGVAATFTSWTGQPPSTEISATPLNSYEARPRFKFHSYGGGGHQCQLDGADWFPCASPYVFDGWTYPNGTHTFSVRGVNAWGPDLTPETRTWTHAQPNTVIYSGPPEVTEQTSATFNYGGNASGWAVTVECSLDGATFAACPWGPLTLTGLSAGTHQFQVRYVIRDDAGIDSRDPTPAVWTWTIATDPPATTITSAPPSLANSSSATFQFISSKPGSTFECKLDGGAFAACTSPATHAGLAEGAHTFAVRARDAAGTYDPSPESRSWSIDSIVPDTTILSGPSGIVTMATSAQFTFSSPEAGVTFECRLDGGAPQPCTSPRTYFSLSDGSHTFTVAARDAAGNQDGTPATSTWTVDATRPETTITGKPNAVTQSSDAVFTFAGNESGLSFQCRLDSGLYSLCGPTAVYHDLADGAHTFDVYAVDAAGNWDMTPASYSWTVQWAFGPDVTIDSAPSGTTGSTSATVTFSTTGGVPPYTHECVLDGVTTVACTSPWTVSGLTHGQHRIDVRSTDSQGNFDRMVPFVTWDVDTTAPDTVITSGPAATTSQTTATFFFSGVPGQSGFQCSLDAAPFAACTSGEPFTGLASGMHMFEVRAYDAVGNADPTPASWTWSIDFAQPNTSITSGPSAVTSETSATITFTATEAGSFWCKLDGAAYSACTSPQSFAGLATGSHSFSVFAVDAAGNADASPATWSWVIADTTAPDTAITSAPPAATNSSAAAFSYTSTEAGSTFDCRLDAGAWISACVNPIVYGALADGSHTFSVRARDAAGNVDATPATFTWTVDTAAPNTTITGGANGGNNTNPVSFTFTSSEAGSTFDCSMDGAAFAACASGVSYTGLAKGQHTFQVRARDAVGNVDASPASRNFGIK